MPVTIHRRSPNCQPESRNHPHFSHAAAALKAIRKPWEELHYFKLGNPSTEAPGTTE
jgi:hypothetical protein